MAIRLLSPGALGSLKGFLARVLPVEAAQMVTRPLRFEPTERFCERQEAAFSARPCIDTCNGSERDAQQATDQVLESSAHRGLGVLSAVYADSGFRVAANHTSQFWSSPHHALTSNTSLRNCLNLSLAGRSLESSLYHHALRLVHTALPSQNEGRSNLQGNLNVQCETSRHYDLSQSRFGPAYRFEVSRSFATKAKKYKIKSYSSYKQRFWSMPDGGFKRMKAGKRHNASAKTKKQLRRLRTPTTTPPALAKVMRQLGFQGR